MRTVANKAGTLLSCTITLKVLMALTGLFLAGFVLQHMLGNLQVFAGRQTYNDYAEFMQGLGAIKWLGRLALLVSVGLHIVCAVTLNRRNRMARPETYAVIRPRRTSLAARIMFQGGLVIFAFIVYHIAHFTLGFVHNTEFDLIDGDRRDLYTHFVRSFQNPVIAGSYIIANLALAPHLAHGVQSTFKTLGLAVGRFRQPLEMVGPAYAIIILLGNTAMPLACLFGLLSAGGY